jgi:hypothetical protein
VVPTESRKWLGGDPAGRAGFTVTLITWLVASAGSDTAEAVLLQRKPMLSALSGG